MNVEFVYDNEGNGAFWQDDDAFNSYMSETLGDTVEGGLDVANESWFKHDTAGTLTAVEDVEEWVRENLDMSLAPNCKIVDVYNDDAPSIFVSICGPENEIEEIKHWEPSIWEFKLNPNYVNKIGNNTYEFVFALPDYVDVDPTGVGAELDESVQVKDNRIQEVTEKMTEGARLRAAPELLQLVSGFVRDLTSIDLKGETFEEKYGNRLHDFAELMIEKAKWVGFPTDALKYLPWMVDPSCLFIHPISIGELTNEIEKQLNSKKITESRIPAKPEKMDETGLMLMLCDALRITGLEMRMSMLAGPSDGDNVGTSAEKVMAVFEAYGQEDIANVKIIKDGRDILYVIYPHNADGAVHFCAKKDGLDDFKSYTNEELKRDIRAFAEDLYNYTKGK